MNTTDPQLIAAAVLTLGVVLLEVLRWTYLWQLKEYRFDRMADFARTISGRKAIVSVSLVFAVAGLFALARGSLLWYSAFAFAQLVWLVLRRVQPKWTAKALGLAAGALSVSVALAVVVAASADSPLGLSLAVLAVPVFLLVASLLLHPVTMWQRRQVISRAHKKIQALQTSVIGITGSFGKSTTKEFLKAMLAQRYSVLATPKNINVDIGVAAVILNELREDHDFFVVEMGAYKPGEIEATCDLTSPIIGVLTAVAGQHLSLYGSLEAIKHTKGELLRALPPTGLAVVNKDILAAVEVSEDAPSQVKLYSAHGFAHAYANETRVHHNCVEFVLHVEDEHIPVSAPLFGGQVVPSILAAATVARHVGCTMQEIAYAISTLEPVDGTMHVKPGKRNTVIIDDHYNSNPDGFQAALDYLDVFGDKRKIVLTPGMYELGETSLDQHHSVSERIAEVADVLMITKDDFSKPLTAGARGAGMPDAQMHVLSSPKKAIAWLEKNLRPGDVILLEGRVHARVVNYLLHN
jgi:UDP-N-acetylmuramoyl-tripeptide--D-alanyl-D-alanine ligase